MSRRADFTLSDEQLAEIDEAINSSPQPEVRQRAIAIRVLHKGYKPEQVADLVAITANTIWMWLRHWREVGYVIDSGIVLLREVGLAVDASDAFPGQ